MKGANEFRLNEATMIEAVQEYLEARIVGERRMVTSVSLKGGVFVVAVESQKAAE